VIGSGNPGVHLMNNMPNHGQFLLQMSQQDEAAWSKLIALAEMLEINSTAGTMTIRNGKARIVLRADGVITLEGEKIVQSAQRNIRLDAAYIDLN
jgi:hypothetical protein